MSEWTTVEDTKPTDPISRDVIVKLFSSLNSCSRLASPDSPPVQNSGRVAVLIGVENAYINGRHHPCLGSYKDVVYMCDMLIGSSSVPYSQLPFVHGRMPARFGYTPEDITVMMDIGEYRDSEYFPTCENVVRLGSADVCAHCSPHVRTRSCGAWRSGYNGPHPQVMATFNARSSIVSAASSTPLSAKRMRITVSGHGSQKVCTTGEEVDGMDESTYSQVGDVGSS
jgi:hypothetical protein